MTPDHPRLYFDYCAGAPLRLGARRVLLEALQGIEPGNPSSIHALGRAQEAILASARARIASAVGARPFDVTLTSSGAEANNLAIMGCCTPESPKPKRLVLSTLEHSSCQEPARWLARQGWELITVPVSREGQVDLPSLERALHSGVTLVSIQAANPEVGVVLNLGPAAEMVRKSGALLHTDAAVAAGRCPVSLEALGCDLLTISSAKVGGPGGAGALITRRGISVEPLIRGGPQERGRRAGSISSPIALSFAEAFVEALVTREAESVRLKRLVAQLWEGLKDRTGPVQRITPSDEHANILPGVLCLQYPGVEGQSLLMNLDLLGCCIASGTPCSSGSLEPSPALLALGYADVEARCAIRISLGWNTSDQEIQHLLKQLDRVTQRLRRILGTTHGKGRAQ